MKKTEIAQSIAAVSDRTVQRALYSLFEAITGDNPVDGVKEGMFGPGLPFQSLVQTGIPVGVPSSGIITASGQLTLNTAFPTTYEGGIWLRFPPGAVSGDTTGGLYWCVMTSPTQGTVYAPRVDTSQGFVSYISDASTPVVGSNSPYTQTAPANIVLTRFTLPANSLGKYGRLRINASYIGSNTPTYKDVKFMTSSGNIVLHSGTLSSSVSLSFTGFPIEVRARGTQRFISSNWGNMGSGMTYPLIYGLLDFTVPQDIIGVSYISDHNEYTVLEGFGVEVLYADR